MGREHGRRKRRASESPERPKNVNKAPRQSEGETLTSDGGGQHRFFDLNQSLSVYGSDCKDPYKALEDVYFRQLLVDGPEHVLFTAHFEEVITLFKVRNPNGDALQDLIRALSAKAAEIKYSAKRTNVAIERVRKFALTYQTKYLADKIKNSGDLKTIVDAVIAHVRGKPDDVFDDPEDMRQVRNKVAAALLGEVSEAEQNASMGSIENAEQNPTVENTQALTAKPLSRKQKKKAAGHDKTLTKNVNRVGHCVTALWNHSTFKNKTTQKYQESINNTFKNSMDLYVAYAMAHIQDKTETSRKKYNATTAYTEAMKKWNKLPNDRQVVWKTRFEKLKGGDADMLLMFDEEEDVTGMPPPKRKSKPQHGDSSKSTGGNVTFDGKKIKPEDEDEAGVVGSTFQNHLPLRLSKSPAPGADLREAARLYFHG